MVLSRSTLREEWCSEAASARRWAALTSTHQLGVEVALSWERRWYDRINFGDAIVSPAPPSARGFFQPLTSGDIGQEHVWKSGWTHFGRVEWEQLIPPPENLDAVRGRVLEELQGKFWEDVASSWEEEYNLPHRSGEGEIQNGYMGLCSMIHHACVEENMELSMELVDFSDVGMEGVEDKLDAALLRIKDPVDDDEMVGDDDSDWNRVVTYAEFKNNAHRQSSLEAGMGQILERGEKLTDYQPERSEVVALYGGYECVQIVKYHESALRPPFDRHNALSVHTELLQVSLTVPSPGLDALISWYAAEPALLGFVN